MSQSVKLYLIILLCVSGFSPLWANIEWLNKHYDYGAFKEAEGPRKGSVQFVNKGDEAIFINRVRPGCGCTEANYPHDLILPGDTATISFTYNPKGRPGSFDKSIKVYVGKENELHVVKISGTVIGAPSTLEFGYPKEAGLLRLESFAVKTGELKKGSSRHLFINAYNQSSDTITPSWVGEEKGIKVELTPSSIPPGDVATFSFYVNTKEEERMGPVNYKVHVTSDRYNPGQGDCEIEIGTIIVPDTQSLSVEEIEGGPRAYLLPEFVDLGETEVAGKMTFMFDILNDGQKDLEVLRVYSADKNIEIKNKPKKIKSGKRGEVKGVIDLNQLPTGAFRIPVEVMTNDPLHPVRTANIVGLRH
ncbi:MAG: DUF1573 domain-containing protein [Bacteroides sp.]|nr:DUF1573 domain-containing protein [Bacteroides sp.]